MPRLLILNIVLLFSFCHLVMAQVVESQGQALYETATCPKISSNYEKALAELKTISNDILSEAGCENAASAAARLETLVAADHKDIYQKALKKEGQMLSAKDAQKLEQYSSQVTESVANIFNLLGASDCPINKEKKSVIFRSLLSLSFDAVEGVSQVLGPYGAPISIGINALKGVITGLSNFKKNNSGYKFDVSEQGREQALLYTKSLCLFYNFKKEADILLNASERSSSYVKLFQQLEGKIANILKPDFCQGCDLLVEQFNGTTMASSNLDLLVEQVNSNNGMPLGSHLIDALQTRAWVVSQMEKLEIEEMSLNESIGPALLGAELETLEDFLIYKESVDFMNWIYLEAKNSYLSFTKKSRSWVNKAYYDIEAMLRRKKMAERLRHRSKKKGFSVKPTLALRSTKDFVSLYSFKEYILSISDQLPEYSLFKDQFLVQSFYDKSMKVLKGVSRFMNSHNEYCNFFKSAGFYAAIYVPCNSDKMAMVSNIFSQETSADPVFQSWLNRLTAVGNYSTVPSSNQEEWARHLDELFDKWGKVQSLHQLNLLSR